jgi:cysteine synthase
VKNRFWEAADEILDVGTKESYLLSRALWWDIGCHVGPSSGFALAGLREGLARMIEDGSIERLRNGDGIVRAVFVCPDMAYPYWDKYSTLLDSPDLA